MAVPKRRTSRSRTRSRRARWVAKPTAPDLVEVTAPDGRKITVPRKFANAVRRGHIRTKES
ncbi:large subunit ribosomal protein L32 [Prauserella isguenensis]|uniref:Large ribosomal subunit protein bL32 n=1 Tax=Prauserella isguenensis TaxID=1470180 RepID=A0A839S2I4_9PSEU|nr:50S ribosomal protein L32 [Prauserella isguenensis]MBB3051524.1 large subunit ribosomal protein L32 [Prauserella isguenensis]